MLEFAPVQDPEGEAEFDAATEILLTTEELILRQQLLHTLNNSARYCLSGEQYFVFAKRVGIDAENGMSIDEIVQSDGLTKGEVIWLLGKATSTLKTEFGIVNNPDEKLLKLIDELANHDAPAYPGLLYGTVKETETEREIDEIIPEVPAESPDLKRAKERLPQIGDPFVELDDETPADVLSMDQVREKWDKKEPVPLSMMPVEYWYLSGRNQQVMYQPGWGADSMPYSEEHMGQLGEEF